MTARSTMGNSALILLALTSLPFSDTSHSLINPYPDTLYRLHPITFDASRSKPAPLTLVQGGL